MHCCEDWVTLHSLFSIWQQLTLYIFVTQAGAGRSWVEAQFHIETANERVSYTAGTKGTGAGNDHKRNHWYIKY